MTEQERLDLYTSIVPNERQLAIQQMPFYGFIHYSLNTFTGKEWGSVKESPATFNPKDQNTDEWCRAIKAAGMKGIVLTCKHHDGFCLWQTDTTEFSIKNSPYKNGRGDVVREVAESCKKYGLKFGVYLSPWDRNSKYYGTEKSQRVEEFEIYAGNDCVYHGTEIGFSKIAIFDRPVVTDSLTPIIKSSRKTPYINKIEVCKTGAYRVK